MVPERRGRRKGGGSFPVQNESLTHLQHGNLIRLAGVLGRAREGGSTGETNKRHVPLYPNSNPLLIDIVDGCRVLLTAGRRDAVPSQEDKGSLPNGLL